MTSAEKTGRIFRFAATTLACLCLFPACASRHSQSATVTKPPLSEAPGRFRSISLLPSPQPQSLPPIPRPPTEMSRQEKLVSLVRNGTLTGQSKEALVFARLKPVKNPKAGLYEDAITLGRLRRQLKEVNGLSPSVSSNATVYDSIAYLKLSEDLSAETGAKAVEAALKTDGVSTVHARLLSSTRL